MDAESKELLREWLVRSLEPVCDADPEVLSKYVLALIQNDPKRDGLRDTCVAKLDEFLGDETEPFVGRLFAALESESYRKDGKPSRHIDERERRDEQQPRHQHQHHRDESSRRRARSDDDDDDDHGRYGKHRRRDDDGGRHQSPRRGGGAAASERDARRAADGYAGRDGGRGARSRDWDRERRGAPSNAAYPPSGDRRRDFPPEWGMPPPGMWGPYPPPRGGGFAPPHHPMGDFDPNAYNPDMPHMMMGGRGPMGAPYYPPYGGRGGRGGRGSFHSGRGGALSTKGDDAANGSESTAKTTLRVSNVDPKYVNMTKLSLHFSKFGNVVNVQMRPQHKCAYVQYASEEEAKKAFHSPIPVCNNRFIEVKWARYDAKDPSGAPSEETEEGKENGENEGEKGDTDGTTTAGPATEASANGSSPVDEKNMTPEELRAAALEKGRKVLEEKRELLEKQKQLMKQKEELLKRQLAQQKELLERMSQNPAAVSAADKRDLLNKITTLSEELKALQPRRDAGDQNAKLSGLKAELSALEEAAAGGGFAGGRGRGRGPGGRWGAAQAGGRGFYRGGLGGRGGRGGRSYSNTLDNRTTIVKVENLPEEARDPSVLEQHFGAFGGIERVVVDSSAPERGFIKFQDRYAGQNALTRGTVFGQSRLQLSWVEYQDAPAELAPPTPVGSNGGDEGNGSEAAFTNESPEVSASA